MTDFWKGFGYLTNNIMLDLEKNRLKSMGEISNEIERSHFTSFHTRVIVFLSSFSFILKTNFVKSEVFFFFFFLVCQFIPIFLIVKRWY